MSYRRSRQTKVFMGVDLQRRSGSRTLCWSGKNNSQAIVQLMRWYPNLDVMKLVGHHDGCSIVALTQVLREYCPRYEAIVEFR